MLVWPVWVSLGFYASSSYAQRYPGEFARLRSWELFYEQRGDGWVCLRGPAGDGNGSTFSGDGESARHDWFV